DGRNRRLADSGVESGGGQTLLEVARVLPETVDALGLQFENVERGETGSGNSGRMRSREEKRARAVIEKLDQIAGAADVAAEDANRLRQGPDLHMDAAVQTEMVDRAAAVAAEDARRMRVVHHHDGAMTLGGLDEAGQRADVAIH